MKRIVFIFAILAVLISCTTKTNLLTSSLPPFHEWPGVTLVDSLGVYQYNDTLYYIASDEFIFKIPEGFTALQGSYRSIDGAHLINADSTICIDLTPFDRGIPPYDRITETHKDVLASVASNDGDICMYYDCNDNEFLKIGFTEDNVPFIEKANAIFDDADGMINAHIHIIRMTYQDSLAQQAARINLDYIKPWPNNLYK